jgi:hypothetical protein
VGWLGGARPHRPKKEVIKAIAPLLAPSCPWRASSRALPEGGRHELELRCCASRRSLASSPPPQFKARSIHSGLKS